MRSLYTVEYDYENSLEFVSLPTPTVTILLMRNVKL